MLSEEAMIRAAGMKVTEFDARLGREPLTKKHWRAPSQCVGGGCMTVTTAPDRLCHFCRRDER